MLMLLFFFVKQKTAYEMRISDWSSDVCSSDLTPAGATWPWPEAQQSRRPAVARHARPPPPAAPHAPGPPCAAAKPSGARRSQRDRKSVVSGTSVSVRVDLGCRRIIKKKTNDINTAHMST